MNEVKISRILHAGYVFEAGSIAPAGRLANEIGSAFTRIVFDPIFENPFSSNCYPYPNVSFDLVRIRQLKVDAVFISHFHEDHCSFTSLNELDRSTPIFMYCVHDEIFSWLSALGFKNVTSLQLNVAVKVGPLTVTPRRALDEYVDCVFHVQYADLNILNVVDAWIDWDTLELLAATPKWDLILWPFQSMREIEVIAPRRAQPASIGIPPEWIEQLRTLKPKNIIASSCQLIFESWSWYQHAFFPISYQQFQSEVESNVPHVRVLRLNPGKSLRLANDSCTPAEDLDWILPMGEQDVDYAYTPDFTRPSTSEIAKRFSPLSRLQSMQVLDYCRNEMLSRLRGLPPPQEDYFREPRYWQLRIFDHLGEMQTYHYIFENGFPCLRTLDQVSKSELPLGWLTEVPISKIYSALCLGESWTSMYMRINDEQFVEEIEWLIGDVDITEDPLVRSLFEGVFGAYQKHQLRLLNGVAARDT